MNARQVVREYVALVAECDTRPILRRGLRRLGREGREDVIDRATQRVCRSFIDLDPRWWRIFMEPPGEARKTLVLHELDNARQEYKKQNGRSGGTEALDPVTEADRARHTGGDTLSTEPTVVLEHEEAAAAEQRVLDTQRAEYAGYKAEADAYEEQQTTPRHREAVRLLRLGLSYKEIRLATCDSKGRGGVREKILQPHRAALTAIANKYLLTDSDGKPYDDLSLPARPEDESDPGSALESQYVGLVTQINKLKAKGLDHHELQKQLYELREKLRLVPDAEKQVPRMPTGPETSDTARGSYRESAAYVGDSADSGGGPNRYIGRRPSGTRKFTDEALTSGSLYPTREERTRGPGYTAPALTIPVGSFVRHPKFGDGVVLATLDDSVLVNFPSQPSPKRMSLSYLEVLPGTAPDPKDNSAISEWREFLQEQGRLKLLDRRIAEKKAEQDDRLQNIQRAAALFVHTAEQIAKLDAEAEAAGLSLSKLLGVEAA